MPQFNVRDLPDKTDRQIRELAGQTGFTKTQIVILAIDRMYQQERGPKMDRTAEVNSISQLAEDLYSNATCTVREYLDMNPEQTVSDYVDALIAVDNSDAHLDAHDKRLLRRFLNEKAEAGA
jgi:hypothetical protein